MEERIWKGLCNTIFYIEFLNLYINKRKRINKIIEAFLLFTSVVGIAGWNRYVEYHFVWTGLLFTVVAIRLLKANFITSEAQIAVFQSVKNFYLDHEKEFDDLWFKYREEGGITENQAKKKFKELNEQEMLMIKIEKHDKLFANKSIHSKAEELANQKIKNKY